MAISMGVQRPEVWGDSNLAIAQADGEFDAKDPKMVAYRNVVLKISAHFEGLEFHHVSRDSNQAADVLARMGAKGDPVPKNTFVEQLFKPSVVWQDKGKDTRANGLEQITPPVIEPNKENIGGSTLEETTSAHEVMAVIPPWTEPFLAYLLRQELPDDQTEA
ncbi:uncharacterized protein [Aegilops tauschii subsp. strangulata]|uniref:uncharacterized protein n=1 Tax=Aegilops tauschii subsp. strangulata TaxID=200361 RepID=UPI00098B56E1|nr:uncharacterized protein LOC109784969 [Aegilops tauschii subsp. strangulata]